MPQVAFEEKEKRFEQGYNVTVELNTTKPNCFTVEKPSLFSAKVLPSRSIDSHKTFKLGLQGVPITDRACDASLLSM